jgi:threonine aldolase
MNFASDNVSAAAPEILEAVARANHGAAMPYGADDATARVAGLVSEIFEREAAVYLVSTGTAANALSVACLCPPWATLYCHDEAHVEVDECGAPEFYTGGAKLTLLPGADARIDPAALEARLARPVRGVHQVQQGALSLTQATELGAVYAPETVARLADAAKACGLPVHMDGTRFANACARLGASPAEMSWKAGVDVLCLGATKNGALAAEAVILFDKSRAWEFELRRKRGGHLFSKMRFLAAQMEAYLTDGLWLRLAGQANAMADRLAEGLAALPGCRLRHPVEANMLFPEMPVRVHKALKEAGAHYLLWPDSETLEAPDDAPAGCRLVCSWSTEAAEVDRFLAAAGAAAG